MIEYFRRSERHRRNSPKVGTGKEIEVPFGDDNQKGKSKGGNGNRKERTQEGQRQPQIPPLRCGMTTIKQATATTKQATATTATTATATARTTTNTGILRLRCSQSAVSNFAQDDEVSRMTKCLGERSV
jgi:hypothetical protein